MDCKKLKMLPRPAGLAPLNWEMSSEYIPGYRVYRISQRDWAVNMQNVVAWTSSPDAADVWSSVQDIPSELIHNKDTIIFSRVRIIASTPKQKWDYRILKMPEGDYVNLILDTEEKFWFRNQGEPNIFSGEFIEKFINTPPVGWPEQFALVPVRRQ